MHELLHLFRSRMREDMESMEPGLTPNEVRVLMYVGRHPGRTQRDLVDHSHMDKARSEEHTSELQSPCNLVCRLLLEKKKKSQPSKTTLHPPALQPHSHQSLLPTSADR